MDGDLAVLSYDIYHPRVEGTEQVGDGAMAVAFNIMRQLCGHDWRSIEVRFARRKPEDVNPFRQFFRVPLRYDAEQYAVLCFGLVVASTFFVYSYSRTDYIRHQLSGSLHRSNTERSLEDMTTLAERGTRARALALQG